MVTKTKKKVIPSTNGLHPDTVVPQRKARKAWDIMKDFMANKNEITVEKKPPPMPAGRFNIPEVTAFKDKLFKSVESTPDGGAFVIPTVLKASVHNYLVKAGWIGEYMFKYFIIPDNKAMTRVYKIKRKKK